MMMHTVQAWWNPLRPHLHRFRRSTGMYQRDVHIQRHQWFRAVVLCRYHFHHQYHLNCQHYHHHPCPPTPPTNPKYYAINSSDADDIPSSSPHHTHLRHYSSEAAPIDKQSDSYTMPTTTPTCAAAISKYWKYQRVEYSVLLRHCDGEDRWNFRGCSSFSGSGGALPRSFRQFLERTLPVACEQQGPPPRQEWTLYYIASSTREYPPFASI
mmetsp:Transcript_4415/g.9960  ORF Transcript_4415/g.9960 Transcript_4415/m.9960 type:complete len:211 (+) Transcript_4415:4791-5423(+)